MKDKYILGLSCFYHDSAAVLIKDGEIISAVQEERFSRVKHDSGFPINSIKYCLQTEQIDLNAVDSIIYYEKPFLTFKRLIETYLGVSPRGCRSFIAAMKTWLKGKLFLKTIIKNKIYKIQKDLFKNALEEPPKILFSEHHLSHAAAAFYPSPFKKAAVICMDGVGEFATTSVWIGNNTSLNGLWNINFPHSLGLFYSAFTFYCGFKVNSGEYKLMGLAPYGHPIYKDTIKKYLIDIKKDGTFRLNLSYFKFHRGFTMTSMKFHKLFGKPPRIRETKISQFHMDLAASVQEVTEEIVLKLAKSVRKETGLKYLCLSGGVALNCVANGKLLKSKIFDNIWIQPASGDAGSALGAALVGYYYSKQKKRFINKNDSMKGSYLGCKFTNKEIINYLQSINSTFHTFKDDILFEKISRLIAEGKVIGWFNGPMEFGPRALGARSIIGDPRNIEMQSIMNLKIKYRESFRPFAPSILEDDVSSQFEIKVKSPYMLLVAPIKKNLRKKIDDKQASLFGIEKLKVERSILPAITHIDYSSRIQTVNKKTNPRYYKLIKKFKEMTGCPTIINTSFNVRGEPIVCSPKDAYTCFMRTEMDVLVLENQILFKDEQQKLENNDTWINQFELD